MKYRLIGRTGIKVSELSLGCMTFGDWHLNIGNLDQKAANGIVGQCLDAGVNLFDTADVYCEGRSEETLGVALGKHRHEVLVASKCGARSALGQNNVGATRNHIMSAVEGSLRRLKTDYIDLYQIHFWDELTPIEETLRALDDLVRSGKVRYLGCSNFAAWQVTRALWTADSHNWVRFETIQMQYSLLRRDIENEHIDLCKDQSLGLLVWSPLMGGWLSGKFRRDVPREKGWRRGDPANPLNALEFMRVDEDNAFKVIDALVDIAADKQATVAQISLAWLLAKEAVTSVIVGVRNLEQLSDNLGASEVVLSPKEVQLLDSVSAGDQIYPYNSVAFVRSMR
jgi:aryl-alcohol dehydrogenase-like predicted oxidoreductase